MIRVISHFGSLYSYAQVAGRIAEALREINLLGEVINLDDAFHPRWSRLRDVTPHAVTHTLVIAVPHHYLREFADLSGRENAAIFVSPNTEQMEREYRETVARFGWVIAPTSFCLKAVLDVEDIVTSVLPLGSPVLSRAEPPEIAVRGEVPHVVHFTSDQAWPGRKGTEELLYAWAKLRPRAKLTIHGPVALWKPTLYLLADHELADDVTYVCAAVRGETDECLRPLFDSADLIVAPSRCEGFGMMISGALVAGVPLLTTCNTGHAEFLMQWPGRWLGVPTPHLAPLAYEAGIAPTVDSDLLCESLRVALLPDVRLAMLERAKQDHSKQQDWGTWDWSLRQWMRKLTQWVKEKNDVDERGAEAYRWCGSAGSFDTREGLQSADRRE